MINPVHQANVNVFSYVALGLAILKYFTDNDPELPGPIVGSAGFYPVPKIFLPYIIIAMVGLFWKYSI